MVLNPLKPKRLLLVLLIVAGTLGIKVGTGVVYQNPQCDTFSETAAIPTAAATTTVIATGVANKQMYICMLTYGSAGSTVGPSIQFEYGQTTTNPCDTNTVTLLPAATLATTSLGSWVEGWHGGPTGTAAGTHGTTAPSANPLILPLSVTPYNVCGIKGNALTSQGGKYVIYYSIH